MTALLAIPEVRGLIGTIVAYLILSALGAMLPKDSVVGQRLRSMTWDILEKNIGAKPLPAAPSAPPVEPAPAPPPVVVVVDPPAPNDGAK